MFGAHVVAYGIACSRKDYDELITGDLRPILGSNAEQFCIRHCFVKSLELARKNFFDSKIEYVFDRQSPNVERDARVVFDVFEKDSAVPKLCSIASGNSHRLVVLQAADMIAWELYNHAEDILSDGGKKARRSQVIRLSQNISLTAQFSTRESVEKITEFWKKQSPEHLKKLADHFTFFNPQNPDYSALFPD